ncbi:MAG: response regulator [Candidatus Pacebacteria bacterium]|nr:response regulator [Candidatus Paceibacterota bacterium]
MDQNKKTKVIIIEDDSYISDMYRIKFESEDFETIVANNGVEGIKLLERVVPDIILLDVVMPKIDGFSVLKAIKKNPKLDKIPVILLTNLSQKENVERGFELGASSYIIKAHFTPSEVVEKIKEVLKQEG